MVYLGKEGVMSKTKRRIVLVLLVLAVTGLTLPVSAAAAAKGKPAPIYYEVSMSLDEATDGLETTCEAGPIRMLYDTAHGMLIATGQNGTEVARLFVRLGIPWIREYPYHLGQAGAGFQECHGGQTLRSPALWGGNLMISIDSAGNPTRVLWHFDHYVEQTVVRKRVITSLLEGFTLSSGDSLAYDSGTHHASGTFALFRWDPSLTPDTYELQGISPFGFTLILTQVG
jgi:hypothetical protein